MKLGILGGTFNPIHIGHLLMAEEAYNVHQLSKVIFIPVSTPPHKDVMDLASTIDRYQMVKEAIKDIDYFSVSDIEIKRTGKSFTIDTVKSIIHSHNGDCEVYLIIGADSLKELDAWKDIAVLAKICKIVTINRPEHKITSFKNLKEVLGKKITSDINSNMINIPPIGISSTEIRSRVKTGKSIKYWTPSSVEEYIKKHKLYLESALSG